MNFINRPENKQYKGNLTILRNYLKERYGDADYSSSFNMEDFCTSGEDSLLDPQKFECGTCMCVAGHGPLAGLYPAHDGGWFSYIEETFGLDHLGTEWDFCFSSRWSNNIQQAINRLTAYLNGTADLDAFLAESVWGIPDYCQRYNREGILQ